MPTPPLDARNLIRRAREAAGGDDILSGLPGAVVPLAEFFANHVDLRPQREKKILRMRAATAASVWLRSTTLPDQRRVSYPWPAEMRRHASADRRLLLSRGPAVSGEDAMQS